MNRGLAALSLLLTATACSPHGSAGSGPPAAATNPESGEGRALEAGRELIGKPAPAAVLKTIDGQTIDLSKIYGREPVYLKFWATWCTTCRAQMPAFEADFEKLHDHILTIAVNTGFNDSLDKVRAYRRELGLKMPIVIDDGSLAAALNLRVTPQHVVIGRDGRILFVGHLEDDKLHAAFREAIAEARASAPTPAALQPPPALGAVEPALAHAAGFPLSGTVADGKPRILVFFSPWCESYWKQSRPAFATACRQVRDEANRLAATNSAHLLGVASGLWASQADLAKFRAKKDSYRMPLHLDANGAAFRAFGVRAVPTIIFLDKNGRVERRLGPDDKGLSTALSAVSTHT